MNSNMSHIVGSTNKTGRSESGLGRTRSRYSGVALLRLGTCLDYALRMSKLPVLIVAEPDFVPVYAHSGDAGADLRSAQEVVIESGARATVKTGVSIALPSGYVGLVHPRSGLAAKHGVTVLNAPGTVDAGYRGEIAVTLINHGLEPFEVKVGDRVAQLVIQAVEEAKFVLVSKLPDTHRGDGGFGSTGTK